MGRGWNYGPTYLICTPSDQYILSGSNELAPRDYFFYYLEGRRNAVIMNKTVLTISLLILGGFLWATGSTVPPVDYRISAEEAKTLVASGAVLLMCEQKVNTTVLIFLGRCFCPMMKLLQPRLPRLLKLSIRRWLCTAAREGALQ